MMKKDSSFLFRSGFTIFLFLLSFLLFSWPFLTSQMSSESLYYFLFITWAIVIIVLTIMNSGAGRHSDKD